MLKNYHSYEPKNGHGLKHNPIGSIVGPRVIGWIGSKSGDGKLNLAPYSFCSLFNYAPPMIIFSSVGYKDTMKNIVETGEFSWNLATRELAEKMNLSSTSQSVDEFALTKLTPLQGTHTQAPLVKESPVSIECKVTQYFQLKDTQDKELGTWLVIGEAVAIHIQKEFIEHDIYQWRKIHPILRGGGLGDYIEVTPDRSFEMFRPD